MSPTPHHIVNCDSQWIGRTLYCYHSLPSTNDLAHEFNEPGTAILADVQTAGRGQHQRSWQSQAGASVLLSVTLAPPIMLNRPVMLIAWAAVAVAEVIEELSGVQTTIKWPNDLLVDGKKLCGILTESRRSTVVGLGVNLQQTAEELAGLPNATSVFLIIGKVYEPEPVAMRILKRLDEHYGRLLAGELQELEIAWSRRLGLLDQPVAVELADGSLRLGRLTGLSFERVELTTTSGVAHFLPEQVRHLKAV